MYTCLVGRRFDEECPFEIDESWSHFLESPDLVPSEVETLQEVLQGDPLAHFKHPGSTLLIQCRL